MLGKAHLDLDPRSQADLDKEMLRCTIIVQKQWRKRMAKIKIKDMLRSTWEKHYDEENVRAFEPFTFIRMCIHASGALFSREFTTTTTFKRTPSLG
jgi:hypothetical protein